MSVSNYNINCGYIHSVLDDVVYLFSEAHRKYIHIDNGEAYISDLVQTPLELHCREINLVEEDSLDERYAFSKNLSFTVDGHANLSIFDGRYYAVVRTKDGTYYMVNVEFPADVRYTYRLSQDEEQTSFQMLSISNHPVLKLNVSLGKTNVCSGYFTSCVKSLGLTESDSVRMGNGQITFVNDGFKNVSFLRDSFTFTEEYDGSTTTATLNFSIPLWEYKHFWSYNLLEFLENKYSAEIEGCNGFTYAGFTFGLQPSIGISGEGSDALINLSFTEMTGGRGVYHYSDRADYSYDTSTAWIYTDEHDGYQCQEGGIAKYLLQKEINAFGNPTGRYKALQGYEDMFPSLNIVGTFTEVMVFQSDKCGDIDGGGMTGGTLTDEITVPRGQCRTYTFSAVCDWNITQVDSGLTITPMSGVAGRLYEIQVCNEVDESHNPGGGVGGAE